MPDPDIIYSKQAAQYDLMVSREDYQGNIFPVLNEIRPLNGLDVVELGAGTGRLSRLLAPVVKSLRLFDASAHMLETAAASLESAGHHDWQTHVADHRHLPLDSHVADLAISGWSICYAVADDGGTHPQELDKILAEMKRILRPGGTIIILETQGTGYTTPNPPATLRGYYDLLQDRGFQDRWFRTDYRFESLEEAETLTRFFFGDSLAGSIVRENLIVLPECTGAWWLHTS
jgi:ubiquinone/menaquinone biosynthesis C-methylase UbiE